MNEKFCQYCGQKLTSQHIDSDTADYSIYQCTCGKHLRDNEIVYSIYAIGDKITYNNTLCTITDVYLRTDRTIAYKLDDTIYITETEIETKY